jgi:hypothetical protein
MPKPGKSEPKIVSVKVKEFDGYWNNYESTAVTDNGAVGKGYGVTEREAVNSAVSRARNNG